MTTKTTSSPTPWTARNGVFLHDANGCVLGMTEFNSGRLDESERGRERMDAAFIVEAVNSHASLLSRAAELEAQLRFGDDARIAALHRIAELEGALRDLANSVSELRHELPLADTAANHRRILDLNTAARSLLAKKEG